jgi:hypothetical protein
MASYGVDFNTDAVLEEMQKAAVDGLKRAAAELSAQSQALCPKERGHNGGLVSTHYEEVDEESLTMKVGYTAEHAQKQHWGRKFKHKNGEQALFLLSPLTQNGRRYLDLVADAIRRKLGR